MFFIAIADVYAQFSSSLLSTFSESLCGICKESGLAIDDEMIRDIRADVSKKRSELVAKARKASVGDPWGEILRKSSDMLIAERGSRTLASAFDPITVSATAIHEVDLGNETISRKEFAQMPTVVWLEHRLLRFITAASYEEIQSPS